MRTAITLQLLFLLAGDVFSQTIQEIDSLSFSFCDQLVASRSITNDTTRFNNFITDHFNKYMASVPEQEYDRVNQALFFRLQRNCLEFMELLDRLYPAEGDEIKRIESKPGSILSKREIKDFKKTTDFYYFEINGDTTFVSMRDGFWIDQFKDGTTSTLTYEWVTKEGFELTFEQSDNISRKNFSLEGDTFLYSLISKEDDYYVLTVKIPTHSKYQKLKLYIK